MDWEWHLVICILIIIRCMFSQLFIDHLVFFLNYLPGVFCLILYWGLLLLFIDLHMLRMLILYMFIFFCRYFLFAFSNCSILKMLNFKFMCVFFPLIFPFMLSKFFSCPMIWKRNLSLKYSSRFFMPFFLIVNPFIFLAEIYCSICSEINFTPA